MAVDLTLIHWIYIVFIALIILFMVLKRDTTIICILGIFFIALTATGSLTTSISSVFNSFIYAITQLLSIILIISIVSRLGFSFYKKKQARKYFQACFYNYFVNCSFPSLSTR